MKCIQRLLPAALLLVTAAAAAPAPADSELALYGADARRTGFEPGDLDQPDQPPALGRQSAKIVFVSGFVDAIDKDLFGRAQKVAIVSVSDTGVLLQNAVEDMSAGEELKHHVGEDVTARGVVLVKSDGSMALLVDAFQIHGQEGGFVGDAAHRPY